MEGLKNVGKGFLMLGPVGAAVGGVKYLLDTPFVPAEDLLKTAKPGDLIEFHRGNYSHWAMYYVKGKIFNIPAEGKHVNEVTITEENLVDVAGDSQVRVNNQEKIAAKKGYKRRSRKEALTAAMAEVGTTVRYSFTQFNCEYYCTKWLYGKGWSSQVENALVGSLTTGVATQLNGGFGALVGGVLGGPLGAGIGYAIGSSVVGGLMTGLFEATGRTDNFT